MVNDVAGGSCQVRLFSRSFDPFIISGCFCLPLCFFFPSVNTFLRYNASLVSYLWDGDVFLSIQCLIVKVEDILTTFKCISRVGQTKGGAVKAQVLAMK